MRTSWTVARTLHTHSLRLWSDLCKLPSGALTAATRVQRAQVIASHFTRVWSQHATSSTHDPPTCGTSPLQSQPSSWPPRNTSPARSPVTLTMTMTQTMPMLPPMNRMIEPESLFVFEGSVQGIFLLLLSVPRGFLRGGHVTHNLSSLPRTHVLFLNQPR
jgi:hypothetical protein